MNINSILKHFVQDPEISRSNMAQSNAIIAGKIALHFFDSSIPLKDGLQPVVGEHAVDMAFANFISD
ncbi:hypothetical protein SBOR_6100 [Sclerotinia borealis F-4128]|uniref:Uncharacterized protein n=1 Tax=Sclerotinia borealis (strain F-4128) TaxID=1432307 RepID=W9CFH7_SCLBF|nr:hypothetical protein SBOR_6100 [Sclerotinia borealis F-4128]